MSYGPYCRLESPSQRREDALQQVSSNELRGRVRPVDRGYPRIRAYPRRLHPGERGISFITSVAHDPRFSAPHEARWYSSLTAGVKQRANAQSEPVAAIPAAVTDLQP